MPGNYITLHTLCIYSSTVRWAVAIGDQGRRPMNDSPHVSGKWLFSTTQEGDLVTISMRFRASALRLNPTCLCKDVPIHVCVKWMWNMYEITKKFSCKCRINLLMFEVQEFNVNKRNNVFFEFCSKFRNLLIQVFLSLRCNTTWFPFLPHKKYLTHCVGWWYIQKL